MQRLPRVDEIISSIEDAFDDVAMIEEAIGAFFLRLGIFLATWIPILAAGIVALYIIVLYCFGW